MDDNNLEPFDDLFEPFQLDDNAPRDTEPTTTQQPEVPVVYCSSCGTPNPASNRHCEACGARVGQHQLPVAPQPVLRATPGSRALGVLAAAILVAALVALIVNVFGDEGDGNAAPDSTTTSSSTSLPTVPIDQLRPVSVEASSELGAFPATALIDEDPENSWNDAGLQGKDAVLTFTFDSPVQITQIVIQNLSDNVRFLRNFRIQDYEITINDFPTAQIGKLEDTRAPQPITISSLSTTKLTLRVMSTYPAQSVAGNDPFHELALQEVKFYGVAVGDEATSTTSTSTS